MDSFDEELTFLFFKVLKRTPIQEEKTTYRAKFFDLQYTLSQIEELLYETAEYIQANTEYSTVNERATYNMNVFSFEVKNIDPLQYRGVQLTNGKTGIITSPDVNKVASSFITTNCNLDQIAKYNFSLKAKYLFVTNGLKHYCCSINYASGETEFLNDIPAKIV